MAYLGVQAKFLYDIFGQQLGFQNLFFIFRAKRPSQAKATTQARWQLIQEACCTKGAAIVTLTEIDDFHLSHDVVCRTGKIDITRCTTQTEEYRKNKPFLVVNEKLPQIVGIENTILLVFSCRFMINTFLILHSSVLIHINYLNILTSSVATENNTPAAENQRLVILPTVEFCAFVLLGST